MITFYDFVTTVVMLSLFLLWTISIIVLFKKEMSTLSALMWLAVIIILPILGPIAFLLYVTRQQEIETQASARDEKDTVEETL
ncbi:PLDc N-terminal domain-containing protein [Corynebacterium sp. MSK150]|uniref:PLDc N-terminal domain-containing protein n=1 Tax=Corynebacterium sp. MSK150 TaxID=3050209 RepID=UPI002549E79A|nr:PLDc N-terminal domain-containing protein [Corynebacterium sp. MSK150]MDK8525642.1 PLDc N-terminal domain-containing protein [Corynebacterium sp. MSK150]